MDWAIKIGYAVMVFAIIMCFIFSKRGEKEMRHMVDRFAQAFCKLSNYVLPGGKAPAASLSTRKKDGVMQPAPSWCTAAASIAATGSFSPIPSGRSAT